MHDSFEVRRVLVIAPLRVARDTWPSEIRKWDHLKGLRVSVAVGSEAERRLALERESDIYVINRENLAWLTSSRLPLAFDMIVVDELSSFKHNATMRFKALMKLRPKAKRIVGLTGTPSSNGLMDLWAEFKCLDMGVRLGRFIGVFRNTYFEPDKRNGAVVYSYKPLPGAEEAIYDRISDIAISMRAKDHLRMPGLVSARYPVRMARSERAVYEKLRREMALSLGDTTITAANAAALSGKLLQMASGAVYGDEGETLRIHDRKLDALEDLVEAANGKPTLVAYWFKHDLERIKKRVNARELKTSSDFSAWNRGEIAVGLIHPASAGHGLNLQQGGSTLIWFSLTWSLELYQQTCARLWRQGQEETVVIEHIVTEGTIDEQVLTALEEKNTAQAALIDAVKANLAGSSGPAF